MCLLQKTAWLGSTEQDQEESCMSNVKGKVVAITGASSGSAKRQPGCWLIMVPMWFLGQEERTGWRSLLPL